MKTEFDKILNRLGCGEIMSAPFVVQENGEKLYPEYEITVNGEVGTATMCCRYGDTFEDKLYFDFEGTDIICKRVFKNISEEPISIKELGFEINGISFGENSSDDYFYHNENPRIYSVMTFPVDSVRSEKCASDSEFDVQAGNRWADPGVVSERIGASPYQPFPAILLSNYNVKRGLVHGTLSQKVFFHNYLAIHQNKAVRLGILSSFKAIDEMKLAPKRILVDEWYLGRTDEAEDIEKIFSGYTRVLRKKLPCGYGRGTTNRNELVWGTWNDGIFRDVSEELVLEEARYLKKNFPTVKWIQLDDGYAVYDKKAHGLGVCFEGEDGIDRKKFPDGLNGLCDKIRRLGLRPAVWIGGFCPKETRIHKEHPEWFIDYSYRIDTTAPLDVSLKDVRQYMEAALVFYFDECGFEGIKHDFWSYAFEDSHNLLRENDCSGYEYRNWWLNAIRSHLPKDGYLETACDIAMGNPFMGEYVNNYRYGMDVGTGNWDHIKTNYQWGIACFATHTGDLIVPNSDGVGIMSGLDKTDKMFYINYCLVTHSMVELAGRPSLCDDEEAVKMLKKAVCNPNNGQDIYFANYDYRSNGFSVPEIIYFKTPHFSTVGENPIMPLRTVGLFNTEDSAKKLRFNIKDIELPEGRYILTDIWSLEQHTVCGDFELELPPHGSRVFSVNAEESEMHIFDANIRVNYAEYKDGELTLETDYIADGVELMLDKMPFEIICGEKSVDFNSSGKNIRFDVKQKGKMKIFF